MHYGASVANSPADKIYHTTVLFGNPRVRFRIREGEINGLDEVGYVQRNSNDTNGEQQAYFGVNHQPTFQTVVKFRII